MEPQAVKLQRHLKILIEIIEDLSSAVEAVIDDIHTMSQNGPTEEEECMHVDAQLASGMGQERKYWCSSCSTMLTTETI